MTPSGARAVVLGVTCGRDGYEHLVADEAMTPGCAGRYPAICGHRVWAAVLACPSGPPCPACVAVRRPQPRDGVDGGCGASCSTDCVGAVA